MALYVVSTPIGNPKDITLRAIDLLKSADVVIGEEFKVVSKLLKTLGVDNKELFVLNEHSSQSDVEELAQICASKEAALVSDCGTPAFCDPGAQLVKQCRKNKTKVQILPGASSLMTFLSGCGQRLDQFYFAGFVPANKEERKSALEKLKALKTTVIIMDTPYRLTRLLEDLSTGFPQNEIIIGLDLTTREEDFLCGKASALLAKLKGQKREFILAVLGTSKPPSKKRKK